MNCLRCGSPAKVGSKYCSGICERWDNYNYPYDKAFLETDNPLRAYLLGLFVADGHLCRRKAFHLAMVDGQIVRDVAAQIGFTKEILPKYKKGRYWYRLFLTGPFPNFLLRCGFNCGIKTGKEFIPTAVVSADSFSHFLRGVFDGDGCFYFRKNRLTLRATLGCMSREFLEAIHARLLAYHVVLGGSIRHRLTKKGEDFYDLRYGHQDAVSFGKFIYSNATLYLKRKRKIYLFCRGITIHRIRQRGKICSVLGCERSCVTNNLCGKHQVEHYINTHPEYRKHLKAYRKNYYISHKDVIIARSLRWQKDNSARFRARVKKWEQDNKERLDGKRHEWLQVNRERLRDYKHEWYLKHKEKHNAAAREYRIAHATEIKKKAHERYLKRKENVSETK